MPVKRLTLIAMLVALGAGSVLAGNVQGTVNFDGPAPKLRPIKMDADPGCLAKHKGGSVESELVVLGDGGTLANILLHVKNPPKKDYPVPSQPVVLDQNGCRYSPHVMGIMAGQELKVLNSDGLLHNVHALPKINKPFNMAMPASRTEAVEKFSKAESVFEIKCDVHPWMKAYVAVFDHPFFAVTGKDGKFRINGLPPGTYEIEAWHESSRLGVKTASVTIAGDETKTLDFTFSP